MLIIELSDDGFVVSVIIEFGSFVLMLCIVFVVSKIIGE